MRAFPNAFLVKRKTIILSGTKGMMMEDLTIASVESLHAQIIRNTGGDTRVIAEANLHQLVFVANRIPACVPRAASVFYYLCAYPAFREGNRRTACAVALQILTSGGFSVNASGEEIRALAYRVTGFAAGPEDIEEWFLLHAKKTGPA